MTLNVWLLWVVFLLTLKNHSRPTRRSWRLTSFLYLTLVHHNELIYLKFRGNLLDNRSFLGYTYSRSTRYKEGRKEGRKEGTTMVTNRIWHTKYGPMCSVTRWLQDHRLYGWVRLQWQSGYWQVEYNPSTQRDKMRARGMGIGQIGDCRLSGVVSRHLAATHRFEPVCRMVKFQKST